MCLTGVGRAGRLPKGFLRRSVCVIYPFWKVQTYKCACWPGQGRLRDSGSQTKLTAHRSPSPEAFSIVTFAAFNQNRSKGARCSFAGDQQGAVPLSSLGPRCASQRTLGEQKLGKKGLFLAPEISEPFLLLIKEAKSHNSEAPHYSRMRHNPQKTQAPDPFHLVITCSQEILFTA